ncbi:LamG domain-containing protein [Methyloligella sp. 2.7D]|uniref:LamG domain-containing protein n=1 Tax=unclassified Methyloligella TaxID=2625955 RepID=UPI00157C3F7A|nr:LamG domain-containing protein [Methyloligella sp. GL2]QKP78237.1 LamG domain-containing protein [Methyloligella sp. GL2]
MGNVEIFGYTDKISVKAGDAIQFHVSTEGTEEVEAQLVRLIHGDEHPDGPGFIEEEVDCMANGTWAVAKQFTQVGTFLEVDDPENRLALEGSFTLWAFIRPGWPDSGKRQTILGRWDAATGDGYGLGINEDGRLEFWLGWDGEIDRLVADEKLHLQMWYLVAVSFDAVTKRATLYQEGVGNSYNSLLGEVAALPYASHPSGELRLSQQNLTQTPFLIAGARDRSEEHGDFVGALYWGKIDRCGVYGRALGREELDAIGAGEALPKDDVVAAWDTSLGYTDRGIGDLVVDTGPYGLDAKGYNRPVRGKTGWNWTGFTDCFRLAPEEFGGIEFHADQLVDCKWPAAMSLKLPKSLRSGVYAMRLRAGEGAGLREEHIVFFVRPAKPSARIAFVFPTATYLAFANEQMSFDDPQRQSVMGRFPIVSEIDIELYRRGEFGLSTYDKHADGVGVVYSSYRRPIPNMSPKYRTPSLDVPSGLAADLSITAWLEHHGYAYDILTDEDLHREGLDALAPYACVLSGTRPEYCSERMLDAVEDYIAEGGRYIYMGANGFVHSCGFRDDEPWALEIRRRDDGYKTWASAHGEQYMATDGMRGGPWMPLGRPPQKLVGIGLSGQGAGSSEFYRRMPDSYHRMSSWITKGVEGEIIGDTGLADGGAAGLALDHYEHTLGTPPHTKIIASSGGHTDVYAVNQQIVLYAYLGLYGSHDSRVRADMTYFTAPNHGAVFACGSIAFGQALPVDNFENNAGKVLANVLDAFVEPGRLPGWAWISEEKQWR